MTAYHPPLPNLIEILIDQIIIIIIIIILLRWVIFFFFPVTFMDCFIYLFF
jgi:hypothetical protein